MTQELYLIVTFFLTIFAVKIVSNRYGVGYGALTFFISVALVGVAAASFGIEIVGNDCFDYGVRAKGC